MKLKTVLLNINIMNNTDIEDIKLTRLSKSISYILRHGAVKENIPIRKSGYCKIDDLKKFKNLKNLTLQNIQDIIKRDTKKTDLI